VSVLVETFSVGFSLIANLFEEEDEEGKNEIKLRELIL
jgi:hypothetical protein